LSPLYIVYARGFSKVYIPYLSRTFRKFFDLQTTSENKVDHQTLDFRMKDKTAL